MSRSASPTPGVVCDGCGKHVSAMIPTDRCQDCGGRYVPATPSALACDRCGSRNASMVINSEHSRLCPDCIDLENEGNE
ncbi:hypothetical protein D3D02_17110 [Halobellus sp. Atlit-38R]|uniref:zinc finger domain-containing protein n=1 Tax=Halobellus sp. Atlit-38R TaxID=2282131 RepID=UPI000EF191EB|nr:zinc finger domain-containing protein [Halobellus sp. Atlit-38R]RLM83722.1 hypothetical protein D3D02_17110 [Halobellus sp. Atlit-38R]